MRKVGFLADTHSMKNDGSDLPDAVLAVFADVDLIVHLGDVGKKAILDRLAQVAPVLVPVGANKGYVPHAGVEAPVRVLDTETAKVGLWFNLAQPDKKIDVGSAGITYTGDPLEKLLRRRFKTPVDVVAFGGTHKPLEERHEGVLFFNPGSPTMPVPGAPASVALLTLDGAAPAVELVSI